MPQDKSIKLKTLIKIHKRALIIKVALKPPRMSQSERKAIRDIEIVCLVTGFHFYFIKKIWSFALVLI